MRALIFDFDGTILDTETPELDSWEEVFRAHDVLLPREQWLAAVGLGAGEAPFSPVDYLRERHPHLERDDLKQRARALFHAAIDRQALRPGILDYLDAARSQGMPVALASSANRAWIDLHFSRRDLGRYFDAIFTADDVTRCKPHPELYLKATEALGVAPHETIAFEDSPHGVAAAKAAGCLCVACPNSVTEALDLSAADLRLDSLDALPLAALLETLRGGAQPLTGRGV